MCPRLLQCYDGGLNPMAGLQQHIYRINVNTKGRVHMCIKGEIVRNEKHGLLNRLLIATRILVNVYDIHEQHTYYTSVT